MAPLNSTFTSLPEITTNDPWDILPLPLVRNENYLDRVYGLTCSRVTTAAWYLKYPRLSETATPPIFPPVTIPLASRASLRIGESKNLIQTVSFEELREGFVEIVGCMDFYLWVNLFEFGPVNEGIGGFFYE